MKIVLLSILIIISCRETFPKAVSSKRYTLSGMIIDAKNGQPIPIANVRYLKNAGTVTNAEGWFKISGLSSGKFKIQVQAVGYKDMDTIIVIKDANIDRLVIKMKISKEPINTTMIIQSVTHNTGLPKASVVSGGGGYFSQENLVSPPPQSLLN